MSKPITQGLISPASRRDRKSYILFNLAVLIGAIVLGGLVSSDIFMGGVQMAMGFILVLAFIPLTVVFTLVSAQRFRDLGVTGWAGCAVLLPFLGTLVWLAFLFARLLYWDHGSGKKPDGHQY